MTRITFTVYGIARPAGSKRSLVPINKRTGQPFRRPGGGVIVSTVDANEKSKGWKEIVAGDVRRQYGGPLLEGPLRLILEFVVARPKGHFGVKGLRPSAPGYPAVKPDVLKLARAVEDACTAVLWQDDAQIVDERLTKVYGDRPCVRITVETMEAVVAPTNGQKGPLFDEVTG